MNAAVKRKIVVGAAVRYEVERSMPKYTGIGEATVVDLSPDGIPYVPVLGESHYTRANTAQNQRHVHPGMVEILLCCRGRGISIDCGDRIHPFPPGTVMVMQPGTPHILRPYPKSLVTRWIWFRLPKANVALPGFTKAQTRWLAGRIRALPEAFPASKDLVQSFRRIWTLHREVPRKAPERRLVMKEAVMRLLMDVLGAAETEHGITDDARLSSVLDEVRRDCARNWTLEELAQRAAMSVPKLTDCVRRVTGLPPHQFLVACRMEKAKEALSGTDLGVGAIANSLGIATAQHFATLFRRETGMSPRVWRARHRKAEDK